MFEVELGFFIQHQAELVSKYPGRVLVLRGTDIEGVFASPLEAYTVASSRFQPGTFMIQPCDAGPTAYTVTLTSHEVFG